jgi:RimJ/RimL family protein N-acetyltransferase
MTAMVHVEPLTADWAEALLAGDAAFTEQFGIPVVEGWLGFPDALAPMADAARANGPDVWGTHLFFDHDGALVGFGGWKGAPLDGTAELGYAVAPPRQGRGIATAVVRILVERARVAGVTVVTAHTLAEPNASNAVLARCGFERTGTAEDPDAPGGVVWRWELGLDHGADGQPTERRS